MFSGFIGLASIIAGGGRVGMSILRFLFDYLSKKQDLKELEIKSKEQVMSCNQKCNFNPDFFAKNDTTELKPIEVEQPKRFHFIIVIFIFAIMGVIGSMILTTRFNDLNAVLRTINDLFNYSWFIIEFIVSWTLTDKATNIFKR